MERTNFIGDDKYANVFKNAFHSLEEYEQGLIVENVVKSDERVFDSEYLDAVSHLAYNINAVDENIVNKVVNALVPNSLYDINDEYASIKVVSVVGMDTQIIDGVYVNFNKIK